MDLAARLQYALSKKIYPTQTALSEAAGISKQHMSGILRGKAVSPETEEGLAQALGMSRARLIDPDDDVFLAALDPHDPTAPEPEPEDEPSGPRRPAGLLQTYTLDTYAAEDGRLTGPVSLKYSAIADPSMLKLVRAVKHEQLLRAGKADYRQVEITRLPPNSDLIEIRAPINGLGPGRWAVVVVPADRPVQEAEDIVLAVRGPDMSADWEKDPDAGKNKAYLMRYRELHGAVTLWPLDDNPAGMENAARGWSVVGAVVDWKKI